MIFGFIGTKCDPVSIWKKKNYEKQENIFIEIYGIFQTNVKKNTGMISISFKVCRDISQGHLKHGNCVVD